MERQVERQVEQRQVQRQVEQRQVERQVDFACNPCCQRACILVVVYFFFWVLLCYLKDRCLCEQSYFGWRVEFRCEVHVSLCSIDGNG